ncbi:isobutyryl-CoA dehydrogenase, mitochondrial [Sphaeroforma arctica JP610]|uniref:Isobutyryl-CoA dehydrogenase, mitochondrial n=1 Tax=Sphaeroforma arctica JP610 TaxID=667725 RepID=A0A0L0G398_9EUKA|nr:isobutyryl-CoA dehydrogenase, mitochondrial [Sphaeroforma arctica JP610]KNC82653.1 isobutyryl-CoA dehydrogenase, mitochondrial [Sphaeroforma arctica JP610]|eukprot:XP_014156555.1 isobutyryl-CoA dehydrogenase, mitochondrial [Sphaeroforma arctica JP610]
MPVATFAKAGALGLGGMYVREDVGGTGLSRLDTSVILEALSIGCIPTAAFISIHNMVNWMIDTYGNEEQRNKYCPKLCEMDHYLASYCLTEPNSGSDAAAMRTTYRKDGDEIVLNGTKAFISGAGISDVYVVMCRNSEAAPGGAAGVSAVIVEKGTPGLSFGGKEKKMGWNAQETRNLIMEDVRIPAANILGTEGKGFSIAMSGLDGGRVNIASCSLGGSSAAIQQSLDYTQDRTAFGKSVASFQNAQFKMADMAVQLHASRLAVRHAAQAIDNNDPLKTQFCAMAKVFATEAGTKICNEALQLHGGYGYLNDYPVERFLRDVRVHEILEGTSEVMRMIVSRHLLSAK